MRPWILLALLCQLRQNSQARQSCTQTELSSLSTEFECPSASNALMALRITQQPLPWTILEMTTGPNLRMVGRNGQTKWRWEEMRKCCLRHGQRLQISTLPFCLSSLVALSLSSIAFIFLSVIPRLSFVSFSQSHVFHLGTFVFSYHTLPLLITWFFPLHMPFSNCLLRSRSSVDISPIPFVIAQKQQDQSYKFHHRRRAIKINHTNSVLLKQNCLSRSPRKTDNVKKQIVRSIQYQIKNISGSLIMPCSGSNNVKPTGTEPLPKYTSTRTQRVKCEREEQLSLN